MMHMTRRDMMKAGLAGAAGLSVINPWSAPAAPNPTTAKARSVIQIWMWGGPSHVDTFDPKPDAGRDIHGPLNHPIKTHVKGVIIGELLPQLAKQADKYSIIRSMTHGVNAHETASYLVQTGHKPGRIVYPCMGAVVSRMKGIPAGYKGVLPPYIVLTQAQGRFSEAGVLGPDYQPFVTGGDPNKTPFLVEGIVAKGMTDARQRARRDLLHKLDTLGRAQPDEPAFKALDQCEVNAYKMMFGEARQVFDLSTEDDKVRDRYGRHTFGQACLTARRLVEQGVPYITINYKGWDTHKQHFQLMNQQLPQMDQGMATLLQDLHDRGLLDSTIIWWSGEFGRGPKIQWYPPWNGGRSHFGQCFSAVVAGGGFKGGQVVGASSHDGTEVVERPVVPQNLLGTMYQLLGIDPAGPLPNDRGLDVAVMPNANDGDGMLKEIV